MLGLKIKELRIARNFTQEELSIASGVSQQYLSDLEKSPKHRRKSPTLYTLYKISQALDVCLLELIHCPTCESCTKRIECTNRSCLHLENTLRKVK